MTLVVVALLLLTLAVTVLLLAARMLADRRVPEQALMASRGASHGQLLRLAVAGGARRSRSSTAVVAPFLALATYRALARRPGRAPRRPGRRPRPAR